jgi:hypothetical protein
LFTGSGGISAAIIQSGDEVGPQVGEAVGF